MLSSVLNLEPSSGARSAAAAAGVTALDVSLELRAEAVAEPGWAFSAERSAMVSWACFSCDGNRSGSSVWQRSGNSGSSYVVEKCGSAPRVGHCLARRTQRESSDVDDADSLIGPWRGKWRRTRDAGRSTVFTRSAKVLLCLRFTYPECLARRYRSWTLDLSAACAEHAMKTPPTVRGVFIGWDFTPHDRRYHVAQHAAAGMISKSVAREAVRSLCLLAADVMCACEPSRYAANRSSSDRAIPVFPKHQANVARALIFEP
jgi:hypothetical protein